MLWDVSDPARAHRVGSPLSGPTGMMTGVAFAPDGRTLAASSTDDTITFWDVGDPAQPYRLGPPLVNRTGMNAVVFAPGGVSPTSTR